jgi:hypothetical protein
MNCKSFDKGDVPCPEQATVTVFWPGKTTESCDRHYQGQLRIAAAMGFSLDARPIEKDAEAS